MEHATFWELYWERPAAVVLAATRLAGSIDARAIRRELGRIAERSNGWIGVIALKLRNDEKRLVEIVRDLENGLRPRQHIIDYVMSAIEGI